MDVIWLARGVWLCLFVIVGLDPARFGPWQGAGLMLIGLVAWYGPSIYGGRGS